MTDVTLASLDVAMRASEPEPHPSYAAFMATSGEAAEAKRWHALPRVLGNLYVQTLEFRWN